MRYGFMRWIATLARVAAVTALVLVSAARVAASPLTYNDAVSSDLAHFLGVQAPLDFDVGVNTVSGYTFYHANGFDDDAFAFSIPRGAQPTVIVEPIPRTRAVSEPECFAVVCRWQPFARRRTYRGDSLSTFSYSRPLRLTSSSL